MYFTMIPLILSGVFNMVFTKTNFYKNHKSPIDRGKILYDGNRLFGENKTVVGFFSMTVFYMFFQVLFGLFCHAFSLNNFNDLYSVYNNSILLNVGFGFMAGFTYMLLELPNSFLKRRLNIKSGKTESGIKGIIFFLYDQIDSLIGVMFLLYLFSNFTIWKYFGYVLLGGATHLLLNIAMYLLRIRRNI